MTEKSETTDTRLDEKYIIFLFVSNFSTRTNTDNSHKQTTIEIVPINRTPENTSLPLLWLRKVFKRFQ